ncbi:hypothetical protein PoB_004772000 [Plakobranchus ocellatus]|uniref:Uncharacterized protein n=1 Tax=Plakobranchus ocellatus TaxID=259542 RepID=A0AAV4BP26_9GAST|nr:hypothetical protein PoB_004772000 [Plakobranchus ocellatus]
MNWVGGVRKRINASNRIDKKIQKEFFERKRLNALITTRDKSKEHDLVNHKTPSRSTNQRKEPKVSQDILAFQLARKTSLNKGQREKANFRVLDLGSKKAVAGMNMIAGKCVRAVDLPVSPLETPSILNLSSPPLCSCSEERDLAKENTNSHNIHQNLYEKTGRGQSLQPQNLQESRSQRVGASVAKPVFSMDLFGERIPRPLRERQQQQQKQMELSLAPPQRETSTHQPGLFSQEASRQTNQRFSSDQWISPSDHNFGAYSDSDVSSLFSSFPERRPNIYQADLFAQRDFEIISSPLSRHTDEPRFFFSGEERVGPLSPTEDHFKSIPNEARSQIGMQRNQATSLMCLNLNNEAKMEVFNGFSNIGYASSPPLLDSLSGTSRRVVYHHNKGDIHTSGSALATSHGAYRSNAAQNQYYIGEDSCFAPNTVNRPTKFCIKENNFNCCNGRMDPIASEHSHRKSSRLCPSDTQPGFLNESFDIMDNQNNTKNAGVLDAFYPDCKDNTRYENSICNNRDHTKPTGFEYGKSKSLSNNLRNGYASDGCKRGFDVAVLGAFQMTSKSNPDSKNSISLKNYYMSALPTFEKCKKSILHGARKKNCSSSKEVFLEICSLEDQNSGQTKLSQLSTARVKNKTLITGKTKTTEDTSVIDEDVRSIIVQMLDFVEQHEKLHSFLRAKTGASKRGGYDEAGNVHLKHPFPSLTSLPFDAHLDNKDTCCAPSDLTVEEPGAEKLNKPVLVDSGVQGMSPLATRSMSSQTSPAILVDNATSPVYFHHTRQQYCSGKGPSSEQNVRAKRNSHKTERNKRKPDVMNVKLLETEQYDGGDDNPDLHDGTSAEDLQLLVTKPED